MAVAEILKGNTNYLGASLAQDHAHFSSGCGIMVGLGKLRQHAKFVIASFSCCTNITGDPQIFEEPLKYRTTSTFSSVWDFMMGLGKFKQHTKFEVASFSRCVNIEGNPQIVGSSHTVGPRPPFLLRAIL